jgi:hypothetical protein
MAIRPTRFMDTNNYNIKGLLSDKHPFFQAGTTSRQGPFLRFTLPFCFVTEFYTYPNEYYIPLRTNFSV